MEAIAKDLSLKPSPEDLPPGERPVLWFSKATFEPTIKEAAVEMPNGRLLWPRGPAQYRLLSQGLYRVGVPVNRLLCYGDLLNQAGISALRRRELEKWAVAEGSNPQQWLGCFQPVDLLEDGVDFEYYDGAGWVRGAADRAVDLIQRQRRIIVPRMQAFLERAYAEDTKVLRRA